MHIFIIPYRNREEQLINFNKIMVPILEKDIGEYQIWYIHQTDNKMFNRGALLNIGFLLAKDKYPEYYLEITYVFHDIDIMPTGCNIINYNTEKNIIYHPYGEKLTDMGGSLGCFCVFKGYDYLRVNGHPNYYGWGCEDVCISRRCKTIGLEINEDNFIDRRSSDKIIDIPSSDLPSQLQFKTICNNRNFLEMQKENHAYSKNGLRNVKFKVKSKKGYKESPKLKMYNVEFEVI